MDTQQALLAFDALSQETRLRVFRMLVGVGPDGAPAGVLSQTLEVPHNTLSFHLSHMSNAGLVQSRRDGRMIIYNANFQFFNDLLRFMVKDCCRDDMVRMHDNNKKNCSIIELSHCCPTPN